MARINALCGRGIIDVLISHVAVPTIEQELHDGAGAACHGVTERKNTTR